MSDPTEAPSPWDPAVPAASLGRADGDVTLVEGQTFAISSRTGDMSPEYPEGLFVFDTRVMSRWELRVNGVRLEPLAVSVPEPFHAVMVGRSHPTPGHVDAELITFRHRHIGRGMRERIEITNHGLEPAPVTVELFCDVDFADLFEVKESRVRRRGRHSHEVTGEGMRFGHRAEDLTREVAVRSTVPAVVEPGMFAWHLRLAPRERWEVCLEVTVTFGADPLDLRFTCAGRDDEAVPTRRMASWRATLPRVRTDHTGLAATVARSGEDLGALRIFDPEHPDAPILAAGAPWFMTVFGRDSLLTAWMALIAEPTLAEGVLRILAALQGTRDDPVTEEQPGKILHEVRFGATSGLHLGGGHVYYGSVDATPLFVMLLGELRRWDLADEAVAELLPHADRALEWITTYGDLDGDGFVEYQRRSPRGLANQGWKDSWDAVRFADGTLARGPIALCEVQGYTYAAFVARAHFAREAGDVEGYRRWAERARHLRERFNEAFWLEDRQTYAMALDGDKRPVDAVASNVGHCLWTGIVDPELAPAVARTLMSPELFSGWGVRTLATSMAAYNPVSYHNGSVWPHDNALCAAGLARYGFVEEAHRVIEAQLRVATLAGGRLPELFAGFSVDELDVPGTYPAACSPQAWAAASPLLWLRTMLRLDPWAPRGRVWLAPALPPSIRRLEVDGIVVAGRRITVAVDDGRVDVDNLGGLELVREPRPPLTAAFGADDGHG